jgi:hypothetical protein
LIFSVTVLRICVESSPATTNQEIISHKKPLFVLTFSLLCLGYGLAVMVFFRANAANELSLVSLIRHRTERSDCIVVVKNVDPKTAQMASRFDGVFDRRVVVVDDLKDLPAIEGHIVVLSAVALNHSLELVAQTSSGESNSRSLLQKAAAWFNHSIARRRPGDRLELAATYFLYEFKP